MQTFVTQKNEDVQESRGAEEWARRHAARMLESWERWFTPFGIASDYVETVARDLGTFYKDPLKRAFIEATYWAGQAREKALERGRP